MEELAAGQKPGGDEERAPCLPISLTVASLSVRVCLPASGPAVPSHLYARHPLSFSTHSAATLLSVCISHAASPLHDQSGSRGSYNTVLAPLFSPWNTSREKDRWGGGGRRRIRAKLETVKVIICPRVVFLHSSSSH